MALWHIFDARFCFPLIPAYSHSFSERPSRSLKQIFSPHKLSKAKRKIAHASTRAIYIHTKRSTCKCYTYVHTTHTTHTHAHTRTHIPYELACLLSSLSSFMLLRNSWLRNGTFKNRAGILTSVNKGQGPTGQEHCSSWSK